ncbi:hypothetical protein NST04_26225 [Paenibacillus sp. FSL H7-0756]|uniref:hypothetical protein n=1 Tax=unclassified Paenibacillus TaxID=185978 RepID=UPI0030FAD86B
MKKESRAANTTLGAVSTFKGGGFKEVRQLKNRPLPFRRAVYFFVVILNTQTKSLPKLKSRLPHLPLGFFIMPLKTPLWKFILPS